MPAEPAGGGDLQTALQRARLLPAGHNWNYTLQGFKLRASNVPFLFNNLRKFCGLVRLKSLLWFNKVQQFNQLVYDN